MSLDDYVRRLTTTITEELQGPIEQSLRVLLGEVMERAQRDREQAVRGLEQQVATLRADFEAGEARAEAERQALLEQHATALTALRDEVTAEVGQAVLIEARQLARDEQAAAEQALRAQIVGERDTAEQALRAGLVAERETGEQALREQLLSEWHAAEEALRAQLAAERETAEEALRAQAAAERETAEALRAQLLQERQAAEEALRAQPPGGRQAAEEALRDELARQHEQQLIEIEEEHQRALAQLRDEEASGRAAAGEALRAGFAAERESAEQAIRQSLASDFDERLEEARAQQGGPNPRELRLAAALRRLDRASTLTDALGVLLEQASAESGRAALFLVSADRVRGWREAGFGEDVSSIDLPLHAAGAVGLAAQSADPVLGHEYRAEESSLPPWLLPASGHAAIAMPISVGGRAVAVLYADSGRAGTPAPTDANAPAAADSGTPVDPAIEILARHAGRCLEVLTISRVAAPPPPPVSVPPGLEDVRRSGTAPESDSARQEESARRYARLLISELKLYNESAVEEGRFHHDLLARLGPEVERARRLYEEKIPAVVRERASWFDEELVRTLAGGDASMLGQVT